MKLMKAHRPHKADVEPPSMPVIVHGGEVNRVVTPRGFVTPAENIARNVNMHMKT